MSTLAEIEAAVEKLPPPQQDELHAFLTAQIGKRAESADRKSMVAAWLETARGAGVPGVTTAAIMALTRGEE